MLQHRDFAEVSWSTRSSESYTAFSSSTCLQTCTLVHPGQRSAVTFTVTSPSSMSVRQLSLISGCLKARRGFGESSGIRLVQ